MDFFEASQKRYSHRLGYRPDSVDRNLLKKIAQTAIEAPSGKNCQSTEFVIIDEPALCKEIGELLKKDFLQDCPAYIACVIDREPQEIYFGHHFQLEDCSAAVESMLLAATASGLASLWIDGYLRVEGRGDALGKKIGLPDGKKIQILLPVGYPLKEGSQPAKEPFEQRVSLNRYGNS